MQEFFPGHHFRAAAKAVLKFLHDRTGIDLWIVARQQGSDWIVLEAYESQGRVRSGDIFPWADTLCQRMTLGEAPRVAERISDVPAYRDAPLAHQWDAAAYLGAPLQVIDGPLMGTICGVHRRPLGKDLQQELPLVELLADGLARLLAAETEVIAQARRAERAETELLNDALTGLYNRRGWNTLVAAEESRCRRYGSPACILLVDLDELKRVNDTLGHAAGDELIQRAARTLRRCLRHQDIVARVGGDEFAVLAVECNERGAASLAKRIQAKLAAEEISASIGVSCRGTAGNLEAALIEADRAMYANKRRKASGGPNAAD